MKFFEPPDLYGPKAVDPATRPYKRIVDYIKSNTQRDGEAAMQHFAGEIYRAALKEGVQMAKKILLKEIGKHVGEDISVPNASGEGNSVAQGATGAGTQASGCDLGVGTAPAGTNLQGGKSPEEY